METKTQVVRVFGKADCYGIGEEVSAGVVLFKRGDYDLTKEELEAKLKHTPKGKK